MSNAGGNALMNADQTQSEQTVKQRILEAFRLRAARFRRLCQTQGVAVLAFIASFGGGILGAGFDLPAVKGAGLAISAASILVAIVTAELQPRWLCCSACDQRLIQVFGPYCPACGHRPLAIPDSWASTPASDCPNCQRQIRWGKGGQGFPLRHCTHCGVLLHEEGVQS
jgi:hypothetical protein